MTTGINFWDFETWQLVITFSGLFISMLIANALRRQIRTLRSSLIPSCVIAGFLMLLFSYFYRAIFKVSPFSGRALEMLTYHTLGLGVAAMSLRQLKRKSSGKKARRDTLGTGLVTVGSYMIQGIVGLLISVILHFVIGSWAAAGLLLPMGFGQGPGQAYNWGHNYEFATDYPAFANGTSFGLSVAAMGFIAASVGGVIFLAIMKRKGKLTVVENADEKENLSFEDIIGKNDIPTNESLDKLTVQFAFVFLGYILAYAMMFILSFGCDLGGGFFVGTVKPLIWGFNFLFATISAMFIKTAVNLLKKAGIVQREYLNNYSLTRISGLSFDLMVTASIAAIDLSAFRHREFVVPLLLICILGALATYFYILYTSRRYYSDYAMEQFLAMYGMLTGTISTGLILLREIDPIYDAPAADNIIYQSLWAIVFGFPILLLMGFVAKSMLWTWSTLAILIVLFVVINIALKAVMKNRDQWT